MKELESPVVAVVAFIIALALLGYSMVAGPLI